MFRIDGILRVIMWGLNEEGGRCLAFGAAACTRPSQNKTERAHNREDVHFVSVSGNM